MWLVILRNNGFRYSHTLEIWFFFLSYNGSRYSHTFEVWLVNLSSNGSRYSYILKVWPVILSNNGSRYSHTLKPSLTMCYMFHITLLHSQVLENSQIWLQWNINIWFPSREQHTYGAEKIKYWWKQSTEYVQDLSLRPTIGNHHFLDLVNIFGRNTAPVH